ncbi:MAG: PTS sugar transporter subunit IIC, partial [Erysipelotrichaceae bacterium]
MYEAVIVGLILATLWFLEKLGGTPMVIRPIVVSPLVGLALGDMQTGILVGATLELVFMGAIQVGAAVPPDVLVGAGLGTAFAILSGKGADVALALALPIAILAQSLKVVVFIMRSWFMDFAMKLAENANIKGMQMLNIGGLLLQSFMYFM